MSPIFVRSIHKREGMGLKSFMSKKYSRKRKKILMYEYCITKNDSFLSGSRTCKSFEFNCNAAGCTNPDKEKCKGICIPKSWVNNGEEQCADGSDEGTIGMKNNFYSRLQLRSDLRPKLLYTSK